MRFVFVRLMVEVMPPVKLLYVLPIEDGGGEDLPTPPADPLIS